jgi:hypothetical protein
MAAHSDHGVARNATGTFALITFMPAASTVPIGGTISTATSCPCELSAGCALSPSGARVHRYGIAATRA